MKSKWIWLAAVVAAAGAYLFKNDTGTLTALVCVTLLPLIGMLPLLFAPKLQMKLNVCAFAEKNQPVECELKISNQRRIPVFGVEMLAWCHNLRTGEIEETKLHFSLLPKSEKCLKFKLCSQQCGLLRISIQAESCGDLFGMQRRKISYFEQKEMLLLPTMFPIQMEFIEQAMEIPDTEMYSPDKSGNDPGEIFAIREYVPGDAIRKIHWKLSEKYDKTMVRDFGLQVVNDVLVLLETAGAESPEEIDAITEVFTSVCQELANNGIAYQVGWRDADSDALLMQMIFTPGEFPELLGQIMCLAPQKDGSVAERFADQIGQCAFPHVIIVGGQIPAGVHQLITDNRVSILMPYRDGISGGMQSDGSYVVQFSTQSYMAELSALEV